MNPLSHILSNKEQRLFKDLLTALSLVLDLALDQKQQHSLRVAVACVQVGAAAGLPAGVLRDLFYAGLLHEIGEIGLMDDIDEIGELTQLQEEKDGMAALSKHPKVGARIVAMIPSLSEAAQIILYQHERFNGTGFPNHLKGEQIPIASQVLAICNAVDSLAYGTGPLDQTAGSADNF
ncbi:MAG TPA: hypothetical protein DD435_02855, partial [Cyanobacteria bacterium UBA8530]|nr:hypothetical protein [Cyanobacteria bacterium UBA8530]